jgi:hypothetical protein
MNFYVQQTKFIFNSSSLVKKNLNFCKKNSYNVLNMIAEKKLKISNNIYKSNEK